MVTFFRGKATNGVRCEFIISYNHMKLLHISCNSHSLTLSTPLGEFISFKDKNFEELVYGWFFIVFFFFPGGSLLILHNLS